MAAEKRLSQALRPVVVTTEYRGVFFGYAAETSGETIALVRARNCIYWSSDVGGFMGLAQTGPTAGCRIGAEVQQIELRKITAILEVSPAAEKAWREVRTYVQ